MQEDDERDDEGDDEEDDEEDDDIPNLEKSLDYTKRHNWYLLPMVLMANIMQNMAGQFQRIARGIITLCLPTSVINNTKIGDDHVRVTIIDLKSELSPSIINQFLPNYILKSSYLIKWPLHLVYVEHLATTLDKIIGQTKDMEDENIENIDIDEDLEIDKRIMSSTSKHPYHFLKRKPMSMETKIKKKNDQKAALWITEEEIQKVFEADCCREKCCKSINPEKTLEAR